MINPVAKAYLECVADLSGRYERSHEKLRHLQDIVSARPKHLSSEVIEAGRGVVFRLGEQVDDAFDGYAEALPLLRRARVFDLSQEIFEAAARRVLAGGLVGVPDLDTALPFDVCWFGCAGKDVLDLICPGVAERVGAVVSKDAPVILTRGGLFLTPAYANGGWVLVTCRALDEEGWDVTTISTVWVCALLASVAMAHGERSTPRELSVRRLMDKAGKHRPLPPELYTVHMNARRAGHAVSSAVTPHAGPSYRFEVAGHPRLLVRRGRWPDTERCQSWAEHGYEVFHGSAVPEEWKIALSLRDVPPPTEKEWIALKLVHVKNHEKGPENAPLIKATRTA